MAEKIYIEEYRRELERECLRLTEKQRHRERIKQITIAQQQREKGE